MSPRLSLRMAPAARPAVSQKVALICKACGQRHTYDVGTLYVWEEQKTGASPRTEYGFGNYFRCRDCGSAGPCEVATHLAVIGLTLRATLSRDDQSVVRGKPALFDGTIAQTPALGESHLLRLIAQDPQSAFLHTRLGNLLRSCGRWADAAGWYAKALALDAGDIEARYHLFWCAVTEPQDDAEASGAIPHALWLVHYLLEGRRTHSDELTRNLVRSLVETLREAPAEARDALLDACNAAADAAESRFVRTLLREEGDERRIVMNATDRLLRRTPEPEPTEPTIIAPLVELKDDGKVGPPIDLIPSLRELVEKQGLNVRKLAVAVLTDGHGRVRVPDRHSVFLFDGGHTPVWEVRSLRDLFRGANSPPPHMDQYPEAYHRCFFCIEKHVLALCDAEGDRTDQELEAVYSALRRRPDGKNHLGAIHDYLWQATALMLGMHRLSEAEFQAIIGQLERSVRKWALRPVSRNYVDYLREQVE